MSRFKHRQKEIEDEIGNKITVRALSAGERDKVAQIGKDDPGRLPYFLISTCSIDPKLTEQEAREEVPSDLLDLACRQIMDWAKPAYEKKTESPSIPATSSDAE